MPICTWRVLLPAVLLFCCAADAQLVEASRNGDVEAVEGLLENGADVNGREGLDTPLTAAARHGHGAIVRRLLDGGADLALPYASDVSLTGNYARGKKIWAGGGQPCGTCHQPLDGVEDQPAPAYQELVLQGRRNCPRFGALSTAQITDVVTWAMRRSDPLAGRTPLEIASYSCQEPAFVLLAERDATLDATTRAAGRRRTLFGINRSLCGVSERHRWASGAAEELAAQTRTNLWYLFDSWPAGFEGAALYLKELEAIGSALWQYARMNETEPALVILREVAFDLQVKAADCRRHNAARVAPVEVHTVKSGEPSRGWQLFYVSKFMSHFPEVEPEQFPNMSSPARHSLPPGRYVVSAKMPNSEQTSEPQTITIGGDSEQEEWQIPVP